MHAKTTAVPYPLSLQELSSQKSARQNIHCLDLAIHGQMLNGLHLGCPAWIAWPAGTLRPGFCLSRGISFFACSSAPAFSTTLHVVVGKFGSARFGFLR